MQDNMSLTLDILSCPRYTRHMKTLSEKSKNPTDIAKRAYTVRFWIAMATYVVTIWPISSAVEYATGPWKIVLALTPLVPIAAILIFAIQRFMAIDELERQIQIEAMAIAAAITALLSITYGFLEIAHLPRPSAWFTYGLVMFSWALATPFVARRYKG